MALVHWRVKLYDRRTGEFIADLTGLFNRRMHFELNEADTFSFSQWLDDPTATMVDPLTTVVRVWRDIEGRDPRPDFLPDFVGVVGGWNRSASGNSQEFTCYSPLWRLKARFHHLIWDFTDSSLSGAPQEATGPLDPSEIMWRMIENTAGIGSNTLDEFGMLEGTFALYSPAVELSIRYERGQNTWELIEDICNRKGMPDLFPTYWRDEANPKQQMFFNTVVTRGEINDDVSFDYNTGLKNCDDVSEQLLTDPGNFANDVWVQGQSDHTGDVSEETADGLERQVPYTHPPIFWTPPNYRRDYGLYQRWEKVETAFNATERRAHAQEILAQAMKPISLLSPTLSPALDNGFNYDWNIGDGIVVNVDRGAMVLSQRKRVVGVELALSENSLETCTPLMVDDYHSVVGGTTAGDFRVGTEDEVGGGVGGGGGGTVETGGSIGTIRYGDASV